MPTTDRLQVTRVSIGTYTVSFEPQSGWRDHEEEDIFAKMLDRVIEANRALAVIITDPRIKRFLIQTDPQALLQAAKAAGLPIGESFGCLECGDLGICCSGATYDDGSHDDGYCQEHCDRTHIPYRPWPTYERMDCDS